MKRFFSIPLLLMTAVMLSSSVHPASLISRKIDPRLSTMIDAVESHYPVINPHRFAKASAGKYYYTVIVHANSIDEAKAQNIVPHFFNGKLFVTTVSREQLETMITLPSITYIESPRMNYPSLDKSIVEMHVDQLHAGLINGTAYTGKGVIVGIIDTGIDWKHLDFRSDADTTKSRILFLLDQTTGMEFTQAQINNELDGTPANVVTEQDIAGHGTHVASIAAGDGSASGGLYKGVAPEADLIVVKAGDNGFSTDNIIAAISYIRQKAVELNEPFVINMSLGNHDGSHDGTAAEEIAVDAELNNAGGRQIVIAAGNEGSDAIHTDGVLTQGGSKVFSFSIPAYTANTDVQDDYAYITMWYHNGDNLAVKVKSPNGFQLTSLAGQKNQSSTTDGFIEIDNAQSGVNPNNNSKNCTITIIDVDKTKIPMTGSWEVTVTGSTVTQGGTFDAWMGASTMDATISSGATFTKLVGMPGTAESGITVGSYVTKWSWKAFDNNTYTYNGTDRTGNFSTFSSMGPTRDGRMKPDVSAPGQAIGAAYSTASSASDQIKLPGGKYLIEQGTSMASPHIAGLVALMLQAKPTLTAAQIRSVINATARKDAFTGAGASAQWGNGKADAAAAVQNVLSVERESGILPASFSLDQNYPNPFNPATQIRFSIPMRTAVTLTIYSLLGEKVSTLVNDRLDPGNYSAAFNGEGFPSGVYFYTLTTSVSSISKKMILLR